MGWAPLSGMDLSKNRHGKTSITMVRCQPDQAQYSCLVLGNSDKIRLIGFPSQLIHQLQDVIRHYWSYGVKSEQEVTAHCYEIQLIVNNLLCHGDYKELVTFWDLSGQALGVVQCLGTPWQGIVVAHPGNSNRKWMESRDLD